MSTIQDEEALYQSLEYLPIYIYICMYVIYVYADMGLMPTDLEKSNHDLEDNFSVCDCDLEDPFCLQCHV